MTTRATRTPRRRTFLALLIVAVVIIGFGVRLVDIQIVNAQGYVDDSMEQIGDSRPIHASRGDIVDANGNVLATSTINYKFAIDPKILTTENRDKTKPSLMDEWPQNAAAIADITKQPVDEIQKKVADNIASNPKSMYVLITSGLSTSQVQQIKALELPYTAFEAVETRTYPDGAVAGNLLGYVGVDEDGTGVMPLGVGVEAMEQSCLAEKDGAESFVRGRDGEIIPGSLRETDATNGGTVKLTIDRDLQWYLSQMIQEETLWQGAVYGTVTVVEVKTGAIRAAAEYPSLDPNNVSGSDPEDRGSRIFRETFEPGSTFKAATAAMLLETGTAGPLSTVYAPEEYRFPNDAYVSDSLYHDPLNYTLAGALIDSSNVALSMFGEKLAPQQRYDYLKKFGVGEETAVGFPGESAGLINPVDEWDNQSLYATTFGQAFTTTAPQVASFYQAIANGGVQQPLHLVESCTSADGTVSPVELPASERLMSEKTSDELSRMIENVAVQGGVSDLIQVPGYRVAAKTGTAQTYDPTTGGYKAGRYDTSIVGFAPADDPQYVVMVTLKEPTKMTMSTATAAAFQKAMTQVMKTYRVLPSATPFSDPLPKTQ